MKKINKINKIWLENFKAYKEKTTLPLSSLTLLLGYNGSGKTSAILGLNLLSFLAKGKSLKSDSLSRNTKKIDFSFAKEYLPHYKSNSFRIGCSINSELQWHDLDITFDVTPSGLEIVEEKISNANGDFLYKARRNVDLKFRVQLFGSNIDDIEVDNHHSVFSQFYKPKIVKLIKSRVPHELFIITNEFRRTLSSIQFLYANLLDINLSSYTRFNLLKEDGTNLSSVLYHLCKDQSLKMEILDFIRETPSDRSIDLSFEITKDEKVRIEQHAIPYFSEGQLRLLAVAAALFSAPEGSLVVFDDVDASIDAIRAQKIIKDIDRISKYRNLQILLTSHNPALLDALPISDISDVTFNYRIPNVSASAIMQIDQLDTYPELISQGSLGKLMTSGIIRHYVEIKKTKEQKKAESLKWIDDFEKGTKSE